jgi:hypothetical protein
MIQENMLTKGNKTFCLISSITFLAQKKQKTSVPSPNPKDPSLSLVPNVCQSGHIEISSILHNLNHSAESDET